MAALAIFILAAPVAAAAEATQNDVLIAARALGFMENPPKGEVSAGIVYAPASPASVQAANDLRRLLENGVTAGGLTLKPVLVKIDDLAQADVRLFFLAEGVGAEGAKVAAATRARRIPCVTLDVPQVQAGACTMGVRSKPKVEILVNRANAVGSGITFAGVFRMMITEF